MSFYKRILATLVSFALIWTSANVAQAVDMVAPELLTPVVLPPQMRLSPPPSLGHVSDYYNAPTEPSNKPFVILIQDLHAHYGVQKNIAGIMEFLTTTLRNEGVMAREGEGEKQQSTAVAPHAPLTPSRLPPFAVAVEGASGPIDSSVLAQFPDAKIRDTAADYLMRQGELTGAEYYAVRHEISHLLNGVENEDYYEMNRALFRKTLSTREQLVGILKGLHTDLESIRSKTYTSALRAFQRRSEAFDHGALSTEQYLFVLAPLARHLGVDPAKAFPTLNHFLTLSSADGVAPSQTQLRQYTREFLQQAQGSLTPEERSTLSLLAKKENASDYFSYLRDVVYSHQLFMAVPVDLARYLEYLHITQTAGIDQVLYEMRELAYQIKLKMATGPASAYVQVEHDLALLIRLADLQATENEVRDFSPRLNQFIALAQSLMKTNGIPGFDESKLRALISSSIDYYSVALMRNEPMIDNTLRLLKAGQPEGGNSLAAGNPDHRRKEVLNNRHLSPPLGISRLSGPSAVSNPRDSSDVAVLVAGGFHTHFLTNLLRARNVSYIVLTPSVNAITPEDHALYIKRLNGEMLSSDEVLADGIAGKIVASTKTSTWHWPLASLQTGLYGKILGTAAIVSLFAVWAHSGNHGFGASDWTAFISQFSDWFHTSVGATMAAIPVMARPQSKQAPTFGMDGRTIRAVGMTRAWTRKYIESRDLDSIQKNFSRILTTPSLAKLFAYIHDVQKRKSPAQLEVLEKSVLVLNRQPEWNQLQEKTPNTDTAKKMLADITQLYGDVARAHLFPGEANELRSTFANFDWNTGYQMDDQLVILDLVDLLDQGTGSAPEGFANELLARLDIFLAEKNIPASLIPELKLFFQKELEKQGFSNPIRSPTDEELATIKVIGAMHDDDALLKTFQRIGRTKTTLPDGREVNGRRAIWEWVQRQQSPPLLRGGSANVSVAEAKSEEDQKALREKARAMGFDEKMAQALAQSVVLAEPFKWINEDGVEETINWEHQGSRVGGLIIRLEDGRRIVTYPREHFNSGDKTHDADLYHEFYELAHIQKWTFGRFRLVPIWWTHAHALAAMERAYPTGKRTSAWFYVKDHFKTLRARLWTEFKDDARRLWLHGDVNKRATESTSLGHFMKPLAIALQLVGGPVVLKFILGLLFVPTARDFIEREYSFFGVKGYSGIAATWVTIAASGVLLPAVIGNAIATLSAIALIALLYTLSFFLTREGMPLYALFHGRTPVEGAMDKKVSLMNKATSQTNGGLIGKYLPLTEPTFDIEAGLVRFRGRHIESGKEENIELPARTMDTQEFESIALRLPQNTVNQIFNGIVEWFLYSDEFKGDMVVLLPNKYEIHGIGARNLIALGEAYKESPIALFHEIAEAMGANGKLDTETIMAQLLDRSWYDKKMADSNKQGMALHYAIRALQREAQSQLDQLLSAQIKGRLTPSVVFTRAQKAGVRSAAMVMREFLRLRKEGLLVTKEIEEETLQQLVMSQKETERQEQLARERRLANEQEEAERDALKQAEIEKILDQLTQTHTPHSGPTAQQEKNLIERLKEFDEAWVALAFSKRMTEYASPKAWDWDIVTKQNALLSAIKEQSESVQEKVIAALYSAAREHSFPYAKARFLDQIESILYAPSTPVLSYSRELRNSLKSDVEEYFPGRPRFYAGLVEDIPEYKDYFSVDPEDSSRLYFRDNFLKEIEDIRDIKIRIRFIKLYREKVYPCDALATLLGQLLRKDNGDFFAQLLDQLETSRKLDVYGQIVLAQVLTYALKNSLKDAKELHPRLLHIVLKLHQQTNNSFEQESVTELLGQLAGFENEAKRVRPLFDELKNRMGMLADQIKITKENLDVARDAHAKGKIGLGIEQTNELATLNKERIRAQKEHQRIMKEMQEQLLILQHMAMKALENNQPEQQVFAQQILTYLIRVANNDTWDANISAEAISVLSPFVEKNHTDVLTFFLDRLYPNRENPVRKSLASLLGTNASMENILQFINSIPAADPERERVVYMLLRRQQDRPQLLKEVILFHTLDPKFRIYAFQLYADLYLEIHKKDADGQNTTVYDDHSLSELVPSISSIAQELVKEKLKQPADQFWKLFQDSLLQDEEAKVYAMATFVSMQTQLSFADAKGYAGIAHRISRTIVRSYFNNANSGFVLGGHLFTRVDNPTPFFFQVLAHELMHGILIEQADYSASGLKNGTIHEMMADLYALAFSKHFDLSAETMQQALTYTHHMNEVSADDFHSIEVHEGGRAQLQIVFDYFQSRKEALDFLKMTDIGFEVLKQPELRYGELSQIVEFMLGRYRGNQMDSKDATMLNSVKNYLNYRLIMSKSDNPLQIPDDPDLRQSILPLSRIIALLAPKDSSSTEEVNSVDPNNIQAALTLESTYAAAERTYHENPEELAKDIVKFHEINKIIPQQKFIQHIMDEYGANELDATRRRMIQLFRAHDIERKDVHEENFVNNHDNRIEGSRKKRQDTVDRIKGAYADAEHAMEHLDEFLSATHLDLGMDLAEEAVKIAFGVNLEAAIATEGIDIVMHFLHNLARPEAVLTLESNQISARNSRVMGFTLLGGVNRVRRANGGIDLIGSQPLTGHVVQTLSRQKVADLKNNGWTPQLFADDINLGKQSTLAHWGVFGPIDADEAPDAPTLLKHVFLWRYLIALHPELRGRRFSVWTISDAAEVLAPFLSYTEMTDRLDRLLSDTLSADPSTFDFKELIQEWVKRETIAHSQSKPFIHKPAISSRSIPIEQIQNETELIAALRAGYSIVGYRATKKALSPGFTFQKPQAPKVLLTDSDAAYLEAIRQKEFPTYPSRLTALYVAASKKEASHYGIIHKVIFRLKDQSTVRENSPASLPLRWFDRWAYDHYKDVTRFENKADATEETPLHKAARAFWSSQGTHEEGEILIDLDLVDAYVVGELTPHEQLDVFADSLFSLDSMTGFGRVSSRAEIRKRLIRELRDPGSPLRSIKRADIQKHIGQRWLDLLQNENISHSGSSGFQLWLNRYKEAAALAGTPINSTVVNQKNNEALDRNLRSNTTKEITSDPASIGYRFLKWARAKQLPWFRNLSDDQINRYGTWAAVGEWTALAAAAVVGLHRVVEPIAGHWIILTIGNLPIHVEDWGSGPVLVTALLFALGLVLFNALHTAFQWHERRRTAHPLTLDEALSGFGRRMALFAPYIGLYVLGAAGILSTVGIIAVIALIGILHIGYDIREIFGKGSVEDNVISERPVQEFWDVFHPVLFYRAHVAGMPAWKKSLVAIGIGLIWSAMAVVTPVGLTSILPNSLAQTLVWTAVVIAVTSGMRMAGATRASIIIRAIRSTPLALAILSAYVRWSFGADWLYNNENDLSDVLLQSVCVIGILAFASYLVSSWINNSPRFQKWINKPFVIATIGSGNYLAHRGWNILHVLFPQIIPALSTEDNLTRRGTESTTKKRLRRSNGQQADQTSSFGQALARELLAEWTLGHVDSDFLNHLFDTGNDKRKADLIQRKLKRLKLSSEQAHLLAVELNRALRPYVDAFEGYTADRYTVDVLMMDSIAAHFGLRPLGSLAMASAERRLHEMDRLPMHDHEKVALAGLRNRWATWQENRRLTGATTPADDYLRTGNLLFVIDGLYQAVSQGLEQRETFRKEIRLALRSIQALTSPEAEKELLAMAEVHARAGMQGVSSETIVPDIKNVLVREATVAREVTRALRATSAMPFPAARETLEALMERARTHQGSLLQVTSAVRRAYRQTVMRALIRSLLKQYAATEDNGLLEVLDNGVETRVVLREEKDLRQLLIPYLGNISSNTTTMDSLVALLQQAWEDYVAENSPTESMLTQDALGFLKVLALEYGAFGGPLEHAWNTLQLYKDPISPLTQAETQERDDLVQQTLGTFEEHPLDEDMQSPLFSQVERFHQKVQQRFREEQVRFEETIPTSHGHAVDVKILIPTALRQFVGKEDSVVASGRTPEEAVQDLARQYPDLAKNLVDDQNNLRSFLTIFVNDEELVGAEPLTHLLHQNDVISLAPRIAGTNGERQKGNAEKWVGQATDLTLPDNQISNALWELVALKEIDGLKKFLKVSQGDERFIDLRMRVRKQLTFLASPQRHLPKPLDTMPANQQKAILERLQQADVHTLEKWIESLEKFHQGRVNSVLIAVLKARGSWDSLLDILKLNVKPAINRDRLLELIYLVAFDLHMVLPGGHALSLKLDPNTEELSSEESRISQGLLLKLTEAQSPFSLAVQKVTALKKGYNVAKQLRMAIQELKESIAQWRVSHLEPLDSPGKRAAFTAAQDLIIPILDAYQDGRAVKNWTTFQLFQNDLTETVTLLREKQPLQFRNGGRIDLAAMVAAHRSRFSKPIKKKSSVEEVYIDKTKTGWDNPQSLFERLLFEIQAVTPEVQMYFQLSEAARSNAINEAFARVIKKLNLTVNGIDVSKEQLTKIVDEFTPELSAESVKAFVENQPVRRAMLDRARVHLSRLRTLNPPKNNRSDPASLAFLKVLKEKLTNGKSVTEAQEAAVKAGRSWYGYRGEQTMGSLLGLVSLFVPLAGFGMLILAAMHVPYLISLARLQNHPRPTTGELLQPMKILAPYSFPALLSLLNAHMLHFPIQFSVPFMMVASIALLIVVARRHAQQDEQIFESALAAHNAMQSSAATTETAIDSSSLQDISDLPPSRLRVFFARLRATHQTLIQNAGFAVQA